MKTVFNCLLLLLFPSLLFAKTVTYNIDIAYQPVNYTGKTVSAMTVGGGIPGPTLEFTEGDILSVTFNNKMDVDTSIHWHGLLVPNDQDGVPYITTLPIRPGTSFTYTFPIRQSGTYWYHSHTNVQEQRGVYGAIVIHPRKKNLQHNREYVVVLSDWTDENPQDVLKNLKKDGDYYALKKDSVQSWYKVLANRAWRQRLMQSWTRMGPMDLSDVGYDLFLQNGKAEFALGAANKGERIKLRIINAAASSYFHLNFAGGPMEVVAADGINVEPVIVDKLLIAVAETYDVIISIPDNKSYEFRATSQDGTGYSSSIVGDGPLVTAPDIQKPNLFRMHNHEAEEHGQNHQGHTMNGNTMDHGAMQHSSMKQQTGHHMGHDMGHGTTMAVDSHEMLEYSMLRAIHDTTLPQGNPENTVILELTGNMERYVWSFNNKTLSEADMIHIRKGENVKFVFVNKTMMHHPLHLHGHFFRILNGQGQRSPLKHTVDVPPMGESTIEFFANEDKDWFFHCHNLYHMKAGMARVIHYEGSKRDQALIEAQKADPDLHDDDWFITGFLSAQSNMASGWCRPSNSRNAFDFEFDTDYDRKFEIEAIYERTFTRFLEIFVGGSFEKDENGDKEDLAIAGVHYVLPMLIEAELRVDSEGELRLALESELQLTDRLQFEWSLNTDDEYSLELEYRFTKMFSAVASHGSDYEAGAGVKLRF